MPHLALSLLGTFRATLDGQPITNFESNKVRALLTFLTVESARPHARETLAGLLWSDFPNRDALRNLRLALSSLRQALGDHRAAPPFLLITRETIQFNAASDYSLDLDGFQDSRELAAGRGKFLDGFSCDSAPFEEWLLLKREQIGQQVSRALRDLTAQYEERGEYERAQTCARQQLELEPWDEQAHQQLMRALAYSGQRSAALAQYETCRRLLKQELNVEPSRETIALYESIRDGKLAKAKALLRGNLPIPLTSFVGRQNELEEIKRLLTTTRLLTLTGSGGCGKTRLALQIAEDLTEPLHKNLSGLEFPDGVWFVDLAPLADPALVPQIIASVLGLYQVSDTPIVTFLQNFFRAKNLLLVLDNCEHLIQACAQLCDDLLRTCPNLKILATSREALNIAGETALRVPSLALPDPQKSSSVETLRQAESIRLFIERAHAVRSDFQLSDANTYAIAQIVQRLDGIPLAIELAAARVNSISIQEIAARLDDRFRLLISGSRTALPRYQTLRASIDWSYDLLSAQEQTLLNHLSVFAGGWTLQAAEAVVGQCTAVLPDTILDLLSRLVDKSLVIVAERDGTMRYRMLETIRQYAWEKLDETGEAHWTRKCHLDFLLHLAEEAEPHLVGSDPLKWLQRLDIEYDNLRVALRSAAEYQAIEKGLRLSSALEKFWEARGYFSEARAYAAVFLSATNEMDASTQRIRACVLYNAGWLAMLQSDYVIGESLLQESIALCRELGDDTGIAHALVPLSFATLNHGNITAARALADQALVLLTPQGEKHTLALALNILGLVLREQGDYVAALDAMHKSLELRRALKNKRGIANSLMDIGATAFAQGDPRAEAWLESSLKIRQELNDQFGIPRCLHDLGAVALSRGDLVHACARFSQALAIFRDQGDKRNAIKCLEGLAGVAAGGSQFVYAVRLLGAAEIARETIGVPLPETWRTNYVRALSVVRQQLDKVTFDSIWADGLKLSLDEAIEYALENLKEIGGNN